MKLIISSLPDAGVYEVCDDANRTHYVIKSGPATWLEVELD